MRFLESERSSIKANVFDLMLFAIIFLLVLMLVSNLAGWNLQKIIMGYTKKISAATEKKALKKGMFSGFKRAFGYT